MDRQAAEIVVHGAVATSAIALLLHLLPHRWPQDRERLWLLGMLVPVVLAPLCLLASPVREQDAFRDQWALLSGTHWSMVEVLGRPVATAAVFLAGLVGTALFLRDLVPLLSDVLRRSRRREAEIPAALASAAARVAQALGQTSLPLEVEDTAGPVLHCRGVRRPTIVVSTGLIKELGPDELAAALAHEMSHALCRDPALGAAVMVLRTMLFFSPGLQIAARALMRETERRADASAAEAVGDARPVIRSLRKLAPRHEDETAPLAAAWARLEERAIARRCALLADPQRMPRLSGPGLLATGVGLALLLFCTVA
jgi:Zn-dependent protease with chaperone function